MKRIEALKAIYPYLEDRIVVTNMGAAAVELYSLGHRPGFFYLEHSMGLVSSVCLGLALCLPEHQVVAIDGDGSVRMNLGTFSTMSRYSPGNLVHLVFDNESLLSVGGFPTATSAGTDLAGVARATGIEHVVKVRELEELRSSFLEAIGRNAMSVVLAKVDVSGPSSFEMEIGQLENRFQFARFVKGLAAP